MTSNDRWRKSSYSGGQPNNCVELDLNVERTSIRDTKNRGAGTLELGPAPWSAFLAVVKQDSLDR